MGAESWSGGGSGKFCHISYDEIISLENLFAAWREFKRGKMAKKDVQEFYFNLEDNIFFLHHELAEQTYRHGPYASFFVRDPKLRHIHKASVRDRVVHQALYRVLYQHFDKRFIHDTYSCRLKKGTHAAVRRLERFTRKASGNHRQTTYVLKCDIKKFFDNINHVIVFELIGRVIKDEKTLWLTREILASFKKTPGRGLPLGNVTSQLFANIFLDELDRFVKHRLREKYYIRYCDDFLILANDHARLSRNISRIQNFLKVNLGLLLHPDKVTVRKTGQGVDFLGHVVMPHYTVLRTKTKKRIIRKIKGIKIQLEAGIIDQRSFAQSVQSYLGILMHCRGWKIRENILLL